MSSGQVACKDVDAPLSSLTPEITERPERRALAETVDRDNRHLANLKPNVQLAQHDCLTLPIDQLPKTVIAPVLLLERCNELHMRGKIAVGVDGRVAGATYNEVAGSVTVSLDFAPSSVSWIMARRIEVAASGLLASRGLCLLSR